MTETEPQSTFQGRLAALEAERRAELSELEEAALRLAAELVSLVEGGAATASGQAAGHTGAAREDAAQVRRFATRARMTVRACGDVRRQLERERLAAARAAFDATDELRRRVLADIQRLRDELAVVDAERRALIAERS